MATLRTSIRSGRVHNGSLERNASMCRILRVSRFERKSRGARGRLAFLNRHAMSCARLAQIPATGDEALGSRPDRALSLVPLEPQRASVALSLLRAASHKLRSSSIGASSDDRRGAARYFLAAEHRPSIFFTADTRIRCAPSRAAGCPGRLSPSGGTTVPLTSTRCPSSLANSALCPESE